jgi:hypothetical protein
MVTGVIIPNLKIWKLAIYPLIRVWCHVAFHTRVHTQQTQKANACQPGTISLSTSPCHLVPILSSWLVHGFRLNLSASRFATPGLCITWKSYSYKLIRLHQPLEGLVISDKGKLCVKRITPEVCNSPHRCQTLSFVWTIAWLRCIVWTIRIGHHKLLPFIITLCQHYSKSQHTQISV